MQATLHLGHYAKVIPGTFDLIFTSPPYNIGSDGPARLRGLRRFGIYDPKSYRGIQDYPDTLPENVYQKLQLAFLLWCYDHIKAGGVVAYNHKDRRKGKRLIEPQSWFPPCLTLADKVIWNRRSTHNHDKSQLWPHTEYIYILRRTEDRNYYFDNSDDGSLDSRCNIWSIPPGRSWHNAAFPLELALRVLRKWSPPGGHVCDPYMGSGTTLFAAMQLGRDFTGSEIKKTFFLKCKSSYEKLFQDSDSERPPRAEHDYAQSAPDPGQKSA